MSIARLFFLSVYLLFPISVISQGNSCDFENYFSTKYSNYLYENYHKFINYNINYIEINNNEKLKNFFLKLGNSSTEKICIFHIGDSHIQTNYFTGYNRKILQDIFGSAGRGLIFPYKTANTHSTSDYRTLCSGKWTYSKATNLNPEYEIGISGFTSHTNDINATATIIFRQSEYLFDSNELEISVFCKITNQTFLPNFKCDTNSWQITQVDTSNNIIKGEITLTSDTLTLSFIQTDSCQNFFELYGINIENKTNRGIIYHSCGVNGATFNDFVKSSLFFRQLQLINPNLVIIDLGTNDLIKNYDENKILQSVGALVDSIEKFIPASAIILMSPQDMFKKNKHINTISQLNSTLNKLAKERKLGYYDYFNISGGDYSMLEWKKNNLSYDKIHLTKEGYKLKSNLFTVAFLTTYEKLLCNDTTKFSVDCLKYLFKDTLAYNLLTDTIQRAPENFVKNHENTNLSSQKNTHHIHIVKKGETLSELSAKYKVSVKDIKKWNNLTSDKIKIGQKLKIYSENFRN